MPPPPTPRPLCEGPGAPWAMGDGGWGEGEKK